MGKENNMNTVNVENLKQVVQSNPKYAAIFDIFGKRQRGRQDTTAARIQRLLKDRGIEMSNKELSEFYNTMESQGAGKHIGGRGDKAGKFIWAYHLKSIADNIKGITHEVRPASKPKVKLPKLYNISALNKPTPQAEAKVLVNRPKVLITLRKEGVEIDIPLEDLDGSSGKEIAAFINNLGIKRS